MLFIRRFSKEAGNSRLQSLKENLARDGGGKLFDTFATKGSSKIPRLPEWLKIPIPVGPSYHKMMKSLEGLNLSTVCQEAKCPNIGDCWTGNGEGEVATATIMVMGKECTRACRFCSVSTSKAPPPLDPMEPENVSKAITEWGLKYVVLTSVDRDDLEDGGSAHFVRCVSLLKEKCSDILVECLTGDFQGNPSHFVPLANSGLDVYAHNVETVRRLTPMVRDRRANYDQSISLLKRVKIENPLLVTKTSLMLGLGESIEEVKECMRDLREANINVLTLGQYMRPTKRHMPIHSYIDPSVFEDLRTYGLTLGFDYIASGPLVRSSYKAGELFMKTFLKNRKSQSF